nr:hypothetical protein [uncultured Campylobacter sp.]
MRRQSAFGATAATCMAIGARGKDAVAQPRLITLRNFKIINRDGRCTAATIVYDVVYAIYRRSGA